MRPPTSPGAVVLTSGGLDSTTVLALAQDQGFAVTALTFVYGQTHAIEVTRAREIAERAKVQEHLVLELPLSQIGGSALVGDGEIPAEPEEGAGSGPIPATYVPGRNLIFLSIAVAVAEARGIRDVFIGVNALDYSGYPDCRPEFIEQFLATANAGTRDGSQSDEPWFRIHSPLAEWNKAEIIRQGTRLGVDYSQTLSCYQPDELGRACGRCDSCGLRRRGFQEAGIADPTLYF